MAMALRGPCPSLLLPLVLLAACLALSSGQTCIELNFNCYRKHLDFPKTPAPNPNAYCNTMMPSRGLYGKAVNTFIHDPVKNINSICSGKGKPKIGGLYESNELFTITQCVFDPKPLSFSYIGKEKKMKIIVGCWNEKPVYYLEQI
ncbi:hypothetical protein G0U57_007882 [Chelydra serpentina]|uniref:Ribonuclease A-domain domain-containing protein n=1 Tax=Chelydra serpentina TaxID=8475 RepID=A0A8T1RY41_CHESE|nr:hypothetical protein G0U57_007882 [Chelydra serpentina]